MYRLSSANIPSYLPGRPPSIIKYCLIRKTRSNKFTEEGIKGTDMPGIFHVLKEHIVNFGMNTEDKIPSCSCKDWEKWHIPCKHFFAIFRWKPQWSWEALPEVYKGSVYLSTDTEAIGDYFSIQGVKDHENLFDSHNIHVPEVDDTVLLPDEQSHSPTDELSLRKVRTKCKILLYNGRI